MRSWHGLGAVVAFLVPGCRPAAEPPSTLATPPAAVAGPAAAPAQQNPAAAPSNLPGVGAEALRSLIGSWLSAQNEGDFVRYQALYAERFEGIKRVGARTHRFDRAGWLADRQRMFEPPKSGVAMQVGLTELEVQGGSTAARVRFVQSYSRGTFSDRGAKELLIVREKGELRIAREEMLSSEVQRQAPAPSTAVDGAFYFAIAQGVVLDDGPSSELATGALELMPPEGPVVVVRSPVNEAALGPALRRMRSRPVMLNGSPECAARIGALWLVVRVDPHFGTRNAWSGMIDVDGELKAVGPVASDETIAREAWELGSPMLVGELVDVAAGCHAVWVRDAELPTVTSVEPSALGDATLRAEAERQMVAAVARSTPPDPGTAPSINVVEFGGKQPLLIGRYTHGSGCTDFLARTFIWRVKGPANARRLELANDPERTADFIPDLALDLDADGRWELLGNQASTLLDPAQAYEGGPAIAITALDCPC